jgi:hypothetical protein
LKTQLKAFLMPNEARERETYEAAEEQPAKEDGA